MAQNFWPRQFFRGPRWVQPTYGRMPHPAMRVHPFMRGVGHVRPGSGMRYPSSTYEGLGKRQQWGKGGHSHPAKKAKLDTPAKMAEAETDTNKSKAAVTPKPTCDSGKVTSNLGKGDWICCETTCGTTNFRSRVLCRSCTKQKCEKCVIGGYYPKRRSGRGDWICCEPSCETSNFRNRVLCRNCSKPKCEKCDTGKVKSNTGMVDWICCETSCGTSNLYDVALCTKCTKPKCENCETVKKKSNPGKGDWICCQTSCGTSNLYDVALCTKCTKPKCENCETVKKKSNPGKGDWICCQTSCGTSNLYDVALCTKCTKPKCENCETVKKKSNPGKGDWICCQTSCGTSNLYDVALCTKCTKPKCENYETVKKKSNPGKGDWICCQTSCRTSNLYDVALCTKCTKLKCENCETDNVKSNPGKGDWICCEPSCETTNFYDRVSCRKCTKPKCEKCETFQMNSSPVRGDWICCETTCGTSNFPDRVSCRKCIKPKCEKCETDKGKSNGGKGDWICCDPSCGTSNFPDRVSCRNCTKPRGDWICHDPSCGTRNFSDRVLCRNCTKPKYENCDVRGDWICCEPSCKKTNFHDKFFCRKCTKPKCQNCGVRGEWICCKPSCKISNFDNRVSCRNCTKPKCENCETGKVNSRPVRGDWICHDQSCGTSNYLDRVSCRNCTKPKCENYDVRGDWICCEPSCKKTNFHDKVFCRKCTKPKCHNCGVRGEWICCEPSCKISNFDDRVLCRKCTKPKCENCETGKVNSRPVRGEWICCEPSCKTSNFHDRVSCRKCTKPKFEKCEIFQMNSRPVRGDWICCETSCGTNNFHERVLCRKCTKPKSESLKVWICNSCGKYNLDEWKKYCRTCEMSRPADKTDAQPVTKTDLQASTETDLQTADKANSAAACETVAKPLGEAIVRQASETDTHLANETGVRGQASETDTHLANETGVRGQASETDTHLANETGDRGQASETESLPDGETTVQTEAKTGAETAKGIDSVHTTETKPTGITDKKKMDWRCRVCGNKNLAEYTEYCHRCKALRAACEDHGEDWYCMVCNNKNLAKFTEYCFRCKTARLACEDFGVPEKRDWNCMVCGNKNLAKYTEYCHRCKTLRLACEDRGAEGKQAAEKPKQATQKPAVSGQSSSGSVRIIGTRREWKCAVCSSLNCGIWTEFCHGCKTRRAECEIKDDLDLENDDEEFDTRTVTTNRFCRVCGYKNHRHWTKFCHLCKTPFDGESGSPGGEEKWKCKACSKKNYGFWTKYCNRCKTARFRMYLGNVPAGITKEKIDTIFQHIPGILSYNLKRHKDNQSNLCIFMVMNSEAAEDNLQKLFSWMFINGKLIVCRKCEDQYLNIEENFVEVPGIRSDYFKYTSGEPTLPNPHVKSKDSTEDDMSSAESLKTVIEVTIDGVSNMQDSSKDKERTDETLVATENKQNKAETTEDMDSEMIVDECKQIDANNTLEQDHSSSQDAVERNTMDHSDVLQEDHSKSGKGIEKDESDMIVETKMSEEIEKTDVENLSSSTDQMKAEHVEKTDSDIEGESNKNSEDVATNVNDIEVDENSIKIAEKSDVSAEEQLGSTDRSIHTGDIEESNSVEKKLRNVRSLVSLSFEKVRVCELSGIRVANIHEKDSAETESMRSEAMVTDISRPSIVTENDSFITRVTDDVVCEKRESYEAKDKESTTEETNVLKIRTVDLPSRKGEEKNAYTESEPVEIGILIADQSVESQGKAEINKNNIKADSDFKTAAKPNKNHLHISSAQSAGAAEMETESEGKGNLTEKETESEEIGNLTENNSESEGKENMPGMEIESKDKGPLIDFPLWPKKFTACPAPACSKRKFKEFEDFRNHWYQKHVSHTYFWFCIVCRQTLTKPMQVLEHNLITDHDKEGMVITKLSVPNKHYINQKGALPYQPDDCDDDIGGEEIPEAVQLVEGVKNQKIWPQTAAPCVVPNCPKKLIDTYADFMEHWQAVHKKPYKQVWQCQLCFLRFETEKWALEHKIFGLHQETDITVRKIMARNKAYINPKNNLPYCVGTPAVKCLLEKAFPLEKGENNQAGSQELLKEFQNTNNDPVWPFVPTPCPVPACNKACFDTISEFKAHWKLVHESSHTVHECLICTQKFSSRSHFNRHQYHQHDGHHQRRKKVEVVNELYVDPKGVRPYWSGIEREKIVSFVENLNKSKASQTTGTVNLRVGGNMIESVLKDFIKTMFETSDTQQEELPGESVTEMGILRDEVVDPGAYKRWPEYNTFPEWPNKPTPCPVPCCDETKYEELKYFMTHWRKFHIPRVLIRKCEICGREGNVSTICHTKTHGGVKPKVKSIVIWNDMYIDPEGNTPYRHNLNSKKAENTDNDLEITQNGNKDQEQHTSDPEKKVDNISIQSEKTRKRSKDDYMDSSGLKKQKVNSDNLSTDSCIETGPTKLKETGILPEKEDSKDLRNRRKNEHLGPLWPDKPTPCHVVGCSNSEKFHTLRAFMSHWQAFHVKVNSVFKCTACQKILKGKMEPKLHIAKKHAGKTDCIKTVWVTNNSYISPGSVKPFRKREIEDTSVEADKELKIPESEQPSTNKPGIHGTDLLDQTADTHEKETTCNPLWTGVPSPCRVQACPNTHLFTTLEGYTRHWNWYHEESRTKYKCSRCNVIFDSLAHARKNFEKGHKNCQAHVLTSFQVPNTKFIDPKGIKPYRENCDVTAQNGQVRITDSGTVQTAGNADGSDNGSIEGEGIIGTTTDLEDRKKKGINYKSNIVSILTETPTTCKVEECKNLKPFETQKDYMLHWTSVHEKTKVLFECSLCHERLENQNLIKYHRQMKHAGQEVYFPAVGVLNLHCIDPENVQPFVKGSPKERNLVLKASIQCKENEHAEAIISSRSRDKGENAEKSSEELQHEKIDSCQYVDSFDKKGNIEDENQELNETRKFPVVTVFSAMHSSNSIENLTSEIAKNNGNDKNRYKYTAVNMELPQTFQPNSDTSLTQFNVMTDKAKTVELLAREVERDDHIERPVWPNKSSQCQVKGCLKRKWFVDFYEYWRHWISVHTEYMIRYKCGLCPKKMKDWEQLKHIKNKHMGKELVCTIIKVPNKSYIDPEEVLPYRIEDNANKQQNQRECTTACMNVTDEVEGSLDRLSKSVLDAEVKLNENQNSGDAYDLPYVSKSTYNKMEMLADSDFTTELTSKSTCVLSGERPLWPGVPSLCPVTDCQKNRIFETFQCFMSHWKAVHEECRHLYQCSLCQRKLKGAHKAEYHKKAKIHAGENVTMISLTVPNPFYVDPKGALPFRIQYVGERKKLERKAAKALLESSEVSSSIEKNTDQDILDDCHDENEMEEKEEAVVQELDASAETDLDLNDMIAMNDLHGVGEPQSLTDAIYTTANEKTHKSDDNVGTQILKVGAITTDDSLPSVTDDLLPSVTDQHMATDKVKDLTDYKELSYQVQEGLVLEDTLIEGNEDKSMKPLTEMEVAESDQATTSKAHSYDMDFAEQTTETTEKDEGPIWPGAPTCCKVQGCTSTELFPKYWHYMSHWNSTHIETLKVFKCTLCSALFKSLKCLKDHSKAKRHSGGKDFYEILNVPNTRFIHPERVKPYRKKCDGISRSDPHINCVQVPTASADSIKLGQGGDLTTVQISGEGNEYTMDQKLIDFGSKEGEERIRTEDGSINDSVSQNTALLERKVQLSMKNKCPVWPGIPTPCQVDECKNSKPYETFNDYVSHWILFHEETHIYYQCSLCNQQLESKKHVKHHKQSKHAGKKVFFPVVSVPNYHFIDPKHVLQFGKDASKESHPSEESYSETRLKQCTSLFEQTEEIVRQPVVQETETFELTDRPLWPGIPTPCQVEECPVKLFIEFEDYWQHWISVHKENKIAYKCSACGKKTKASQQIKHIESKHPGQNVSFAFTKVPKPLYKDPKEVKPYRIIKATEQQNQGKSSVACSSVNNVSEELLKRSSKTVTDTGIKMDENSTTWEADDSKNHNAEKYEIEEIRFALSSDATFESSYKNKDKERHDTKVAMVPAFRNYESDTRNTRSSYIGMNDDNKTTEEQNVQVAENSDLRSRNIFNALLAEGVSVQSSVLSDSRDSKASSNKQNIITDPKETDGEKQVKCCKILESDIGNTATGLFDITDHNSVVEDQNKEAKEKDTLMGRNIFNILEQEEEDLNDKNNFRDLHSQSSSQTIPTNVSNEASSENDRAVVVRTDVLETADDTGPLVTEQKILKDSTTDQDSSAKAVDADASPVWPGIPTTCPVKDCSVRKPFKTFKQFTGHWESVHTKLINSYECQLCHATFKQSFRAERHKSVKLHIGEDVRITTVPVPNTMYVDPKGVKAFRTVSFEEPHNRDEVKMKSEEIFMEQLSRKEEIVPVSCMGTSNKGETSTIISSDLKVKDEQHTGDKEEIKKDSDATKEISKLKNVSVSSRKETDKNVSNVESVLAVNVSAEEETACNSSDNINVSSSDHLISEKLSTESTIVEVPIQSLGTSDIGFETSQKIEKEDSEELLAKIGDTPTHPVKRKMENTSNASSIPVKRSKYVFGTDEGKELAEDTVIRKTDWKNIKIANIIEKPEAQEKKSESEKRKKTEKEVYEEFKATINCTPTRQTKRKMESTSNISSKVLKRSPQKSEPHKGKNTDVSYTNSFKGEVQKTFDNTVRIQQLDMFSLRAFDVERYKQNCPVWPRKPSPCPVEECAKLGNYRCFSQFVEHWKKVHNKHMCTFVCINCLKELTFKGLEKHKHKGITNLKVFHKSCIKIVKPNKLYVDPKGIFPFKISDKSCSENPYMTEELFDMRPEILTDITVTGEINQEKQKMTKITEMITKNETQIALKTSEDRKEGSKEIKQKVKTVPDKIPIKNLPIWKDGSLCPVPTCVLNHQRFEKFHSFLLHWRVLHNNSAHVYTCQLCQAVYNEYGLARKHKDMSGHKWEHMTQTVVPNSLYIDTEGCLPYRTFHMESLEHWDVYPYANNDYFNRRPELEVKEEMSAEIQEDTQPNVLDVKSKRKAMIKMTKIPQKSLPLWGIGEANCPVPACKVMFPAFETFDAFLKHWKIVHNNSIRVYSCQVCQIQFESYSQARKHKYKGLNRHSWKDVLVSIVPNNFYIDTEGYLPYRHKGMLSEEHWDTSPYSTADYFNIDLEDERVKQVYNTTENVCVSALQMGIDAFPDGEATGLIAEEESANNECVDEEPSLLSEKALGDFKAELAYTNLNSVNQETVGIPLPSCQMFVKDTSRLFSIETIPLAMRNGSMYDELLEPLSAPDDSTNIANDDDSTNIGKKVDGIKSKSNDAKQVLNIETVVGHYNDRRDSEYLEQMFSFEVPKMQDQHSEFDTEFSLSHDESIATIEASSYSAYHESDNSGDSDDKRIIVFKDDNTMGENIESTADSAEMKNMIVASAETATEAHIEIKSIDLEKTSCQLEKSRLHSITEDTGYMPILEPDHTRRYRDESIDWKSPEVPHVEDGQNIRDIIRGLLSDNSEAEKESVSDSESVIRQAGERNNTEKEWADKSFHESGMFLQNQHGKTNDAEDSFSDISDSSMAFDGDEKEADTVRTESIKETDNLALTSSSYEVQPHNSSVTYYSGSVHKSSPDKVIYTDGMTGTSTTIMEEVPSSSFEKTHIEKSKVDHEHQSHLARPLAQSVQTLELAGEKQNPSHDQQTQQTWPLAPSPCTVLFCQSFGKFITFEEFMDHWNKVHRETMSAFHCSFCNMKFSQLEHAEFHSNPDTHKGHAFTVNLAPIKNQFYVDPKGVLPYKYVSPEEKEKLESAQTLLMSIRAKLDAMKSKV